MVYAVDACNQPEELGSLRHTTEIPTRPVDSATDGMQISLDSQRDAEFHVIYSVRIEDSDDDLYVRRHILGAEYGHCSCRRRNILQGGLHLQKEIRTRERSRLG